MAGETLQVAVPGFYGEAVVQHITDKENPHDTDKDQVGLNLTPNFAAATPLQVAQGNRGDLLVTPEGVAAALEQHTDMVVVEAVEARDSAEAQAINALASVTRTQEMAINATDSAHRAADYAEVVAQTAGIKSSVTQGLLETVTGEFFNVISPEDGELTILYENLGGVAVERGRAVGSSAVRALDEYVRTMLRLDSVDGVAVCLVDANGTRTWLEANDVDGGLTVLAAEHVRKSTGVSLLEDAYGYALCATDANGKMLELAYDDESGAVADWVLKNWAVRLSPLLGVVETFPKVAHNNLPQLRRTRMKFGQLRAKDAGTQLSLGLIGDSYTAGTPYYIRELTKALARDHGFAGPGFMGFNHGGSLNDSNFIYNDGNVLYYGGSWIKSALGTASPDNRTIKAGAVGDYVGIQAADNLDANINTAITSAKLLYLGDGTNPVVRYRWSDASAWVNVTLTGSGSLSVPFTPPVGANWKFRLEVVSGRPTLFGLYAKNDSNGVIVNKMAASGSSSGDWVKPSDPTFMAQFKASCALIPVDTYMIMLGGNDQGTGVTPAAFLANLQALIAALRQINPAADFHVTIRQDTSRVSVYPMSAYAEVTRTWCWSQKIPCSDMQYAFGTNPVDYASDGIFPLIDTDKTHPISSTGGRLITEFMYRALHDAQ